MLKRVMMQSLLGAIFIAAGLVLAGAACSSELPGKWTLTVENPEHVVVATLKVKFTDKQAASCMSGEWKVLDIVSAKTRNNSFFPVSDPLSYQIKDNQLTIGRNEICDAYLRLQGPLGGSSIRGDYFSLGLGGTTPRGYFELSQER